MSRHSRNERGRRPSWIRGILDLVMPMSEPEPPQLLERWATPLSALRVQSEQVVKAAPILEALQQVFQDRVLSGEQSKPGVRMLTAEIEIARGRSSAAPGQSGHS
jgi:hypothetical protein